MMSIGKLPMFVVFSPQEISQWLTGMVCRGIPVVWCSRSFIVMLLLP